jgi:hypothetical protein
VELGIGALALSLLTLLLATVSCDGGHRTQERGNIAKAISNCRQIITALRIYSGDHDGKYPDAQVQGARTANTVFRKLFDEGVLDNEMIFGAPVSPFVPDGKIEDTYLGPQDTKFAKAVEAGENHWAMTAGLNDSAPGKIPLVYENPVSAAWPPRWNADMASKPVRGRTWKKGIIIGLNDSSVSIQPLASEHGPSVGLKPDSVAGKDAFEAAIDPKTFPKGELLNVE